MATHYDTLGVSSTATATEIRTAFRRLAKQYHPDRNTTATAHDRFCQIYVAYEILSDANKRRIYDQTCAGAAREESVAVSTWNREAERRGEEFAKMPFDLFARQVLKRTLSGAHLLLFLISGCLLVS